MDLRKLKTLIELVAESGIAELEVTEDEGKVRIVNSNAHGNIQHVQHSAHFMPAMHNPNMQNMGNFDNQNIASNNNVSIATPPTEAVDETKLIKSPMVGTFYRSPNPGAAPFISIGDSVVLGQPLCIIEAMKLLNEIESEQTGVVKQILIENGQPVEYGQTLFILE
jgi:acetyl-CoA carboxylase biotin carboxyl carrier protein